MFPFLGGRETIFFNWPTDTEYYVELRAGRYEGQRVKDMSDGERVSNRIMMDLNSKLEAANGRPPALFQFLVPLRR